MSLTKIHKPIDCTLLIGIPISIEDFEKHKKNLFKSDFLETCCKSRLSFYNEVYKPINETLPLIQKNGCIVNNIYNNNIIKESFNKDVVILFTHWHNKEIEACGRMLSDEEFCELIPKNYNGIIDICACQPEDNLVVTIKQRAPNATVKCTLTRISPSIWIEITSLTIYLLKKHDINYIESSKLVLKQIFKSHHDQYKKTPKWTTISFWNISKILGLLNKQN